MTYYVFFTDSTCSMHTMGSKHMPLLPICYNFKLTTYARYLLLNSVWVQPVDHKCLLIEQLVIRIDRALC